MDVDDSNMPKSLYTKFDESWRNLMILMHVDYFLWIMIIFEWICTKLDEKLEVLVLVMKSRFVK
jgi:hypothetical protein